MKRVVSKQPKLTCPDCGQAGVVQYLPQEIDRDLSYEKITVPTETGPQQLTVAILRITYQRDYLCSNCGHQWSKTFTTENQTHV